MSRRKRNTATPKLKIRFRWRHNASPPEGLRSEWGEYQVVEGHRVIGRFDFLFNAQRLYPDAVPDDSCKS